MKKLNTLVIGSGASGLAAAVRLHTLGVNDIAIYTEGLNMGTSINTGSDKQTYYKLGMYGAEPDSPSLMAADLMGGGSMHGDIALVEAAMSPLAFHHLAALGVPFPRDEYGQHIGYKTDHDPKRRATSCGPYTSRDMCNVLIREVKQRNIEIQEKRVAVKLLVKERKCCGAIFIDTSAPETSFEAVLAENVVFAVGGPGGFFARSVYPAVHTGAIGLAIAEGAKTRNLPEFQFGMASTKFRWNVSGSYMQVLPRIISTAADGASDEQEFLRPYFKSTAEMYDMIFLKGYQWPFSAGHVPGSSLIDIYVNDEITKYNRRVFLDYRTDPADFDFNALNRETREYLTRSGAIAQSPIERLQLLNAPAIGLYRRYSIDIAGEPLEIAVCAQHNNGGLAGNIWWESENIKGLFPIGEVNGSHGVTRPGGTALNAGQAGAFRAAEYIAAMRQHSTAGYCKFAQNELDKLQKELDRPACLNWKEERKKFQLRMSAKAAFIRRKQDLLEALQETEKQLDKLNADGLQNLSAGDTAEALRNRQLLTAQKLYLAAIIKQIQDGVGSRGSSIVITDGKFSIGPENQEFRKFTLTAMLDSSGNAVTEWEKCRPLPETDGWFENIWRDCREKRIYKKSRRTK